jgi:hypothetical protein
MGSKRKSTVALFVIIFSSAILLIFLFNPTDHSFFIPCPFNYATGYHCPGCGSQRAIHQLLHGNLSTAFWLNPLLILSLPLIIYALGQKGYNYIFGTDHRVGLFYNMFFIYGFFGLALLFWILRNVPYHPFSLLAP